MCYILFLRPSGHYCWTIALLTYIHHSMHSMQCYITALLTYVRHSMHSMQWANIRKKRDDSEDDSDIANDIAGESKREMTQINCESVQFLMKNEWSIMIEMINHQIQWWIRSNYRVNDPWSTTFSMISNIQRRITNDMDQTAIHGQREKDVKWSKQCLDRRESRYYERNTSITSKNT